MHNPHHIPRQGIFVISSRDHHAPGRYHSFHLDWFWPAYIYDLGRLRQYNIGAEYSFLFNPNPSTTIQRLPIKHPSSMITGLA